MSENPKNLSHDAAIKALCDCAATVTVLSYQEVIEGYFSLRGLSIPGEPASVAVEAGCLCGEKGWPTDDGHAVNCPAHVGYGNYLSLSKPTPVEAGMREDNRKMRQALDLISTWSPNTGGRLFPVATAQAAIAALSETLPVEREV